MKKHVYAIDGAGTITGLHHDFLSEIPAKKSVERASKVEYQDAFGAWTVEILLGKFAGCFLPRLYTKRQEALQDEVSFFNTNILAGGI